MTNGKAGYLDLDGGKMYYEVGGAGETLVLNHAGFVDSRMWDDQWDDFTQRYQTIRYDLRGFGKSDPAHTAASRRQDLYRLLEHLGVARAYLLGCSLGGEAVIDFALDHPERVAALILVSTVPGGFEMQGEPPPDLLKMMAALEQGDLASASELQMRIWLDGPFRQPGQVDPAVRRRAAEMSLTALAKGMWGAADAKPLDPLNPPAAQRLSELRVPTLILAGALDDPEILRAADQMAAEIPAARKFILPDSAHLPNMEKPAEFNQAVLGFLDSMR